MNKVSIIVPVYNTARTLDKCINSIINQTMRDWQLILVNDASTDDSGDICREYMAQDERICAIDMPQNGGPAAARNRGLKQVTGEFITFVDADDFIDRDALASMVERIGDDDVLCCGYRVMTPKYELVREVPANDVAKYRLTTVCAKLFRTNFLRKNAIHFVEDQIFEDVIFSFDWWMCDPKVVTDATIGYNYIDNPHTNKQALLTEENIKKLFRTLNERANNNRRLNGDFNILQMRWQIWRQRLMMVNMKLDDSLLESVETLMPEFLTNITNPIVSGIAEPLIKGITAPITAITNPILKIVKGENND